MAYPLARIVKTQLSEVISSQFDRKSHKWIGRGEKTWISGPSQMEVEKAAKAWVCPAKIACT